MTQDQPPRADFTALADLLRGARNLLKNWREPDEGYLPRLHAGWDTIRLIDQMGDELHHQRRALLNEIRLDELDRAAKVDKLLAEYNSRSLTRRFNDDTPTLATSQRDFWGNNLAGGAR